MFQGRVTLDPLATSKGLGLPITAFVDHELHQDADSETVVGGMTGFEQACFIAEAQVDAHLVAGMIGLGESVVLRPQVPEVGFLVARFDHYDPDGATDDAQTKLWVGLGKDFLDKVGLAALYETTMPEAPGATPLRAVVVHGQAGF